MKRIQTQSEVQAHIVLSLTETEARALQALTVYGADAFLKYFYEHLGTTYLKPHEAGLRSLFETIKGELPAHLNRIDKARAAFSAATPAPRNGL